MPELVVILTGDVVKTAFSRAEQPQLTTSPQDSALYSVTGVFDAAFAEAWLMIEELVGDSLRLGWEQTKGRVASVADYVKNASVQLGNKSAEFQERLLKRLRLVVSETFDLILSSMRNEIKIGDRSYRLTSVELQQKLVFSGSLEASLTALCKFVGSGEFTVTGSYAIPDVPPTVLTR
jgi:hypothetical protein